MTVWIGTSGWSYKHWRGAFYPEGLPVRAELGHASSVFRTLEINRSFYALLDPETCVSWRDTTPKNFLFALKGSRFITHSKKLRDAETPLANFFASGPLLLGRKLGPIVWQLPATLPFDRARLAAFFALLPRTFRAAAALAGRHDHRVSGPHIGTAVRGALRHAIEPRHPSFAEPAFAELAREHGVAIVVADSASWPLFEQITTDFMYVRLHGHERTYASAYDAPALDAWAAKIRRWAAPKRGAARDVYVYFDNDMQAFAPRDAQALVARLDPTSCKPRRVS